MPVPPSVPPLTERPESALHVLRRAIMLSWGGTAADLGRLIVRRYRSRQPGVPALGDMDAGVAIG